ncbi:MAG: GNAT family N-acetyltransferase [Saprospiraceae bacterium]|nr:GNAT family N-acetyltransferase [Saprospiraceae bacterium]
MSVIFETERLVVRQFTTADYDNLFLLHGNPEVMRYIRPVNTKEESDVFLDMALETYASSYMGRWAVDEKLTGNFAGTFVIVPIPDDPEKIQLGYSFTPENWGKGFATEVTRAGLDYFRNNTR